MYISVKIVVFNKMCLCFSLDCAMLSGCFHLGNDQYRGLYMIRMLMNRSDYLLLFVSVHTD